VVPDLTITNPTGAEPGLIQ